MAFGVLNYAFGIVMISAYACTAVTLRRYLRQRSNFVLSFVLFLLAYGTAAATYFFRGFFVRWDPMEMALWMTQNYFYVLMASSFALFMLYPLIQEQLGRRSRHLLIATIAGVIAVSILNVILISTLGVAHTYTDYYGVEHYAFEYPSGSGNYLVYYYTLAADVMMVSIGLALLAVSYRRETDAFYRRRTLMLLAGVALTTYGQLFLLTNALAILTPFTSIAGTVLMSLGVVPRRK
ncbi:MAG: hypothetical protein QXS20_08845 [Candidatus Thorarchaeota archaeon]